MKIMVSIIGLSILAVTLCIATDPVNEVLPGCETTFHKQMANSKTSESECAAFTDLRHCILYSLGIGLPFHLNHHFPNLN